MEIKIYSRTHNDGGAALGGWEQPAPEGTPIERLELHVFPVPNNHDERRLVGSMSQDQVGKKKRQNRGGSSRVREVGGPAVR